MSKFMNKNEGIGDRIARVSIGLVLLAMTVVEPRTAWGLIGLVPLVTGLVGTCPIYSLLGLSTCTVDKTTTAS